MTTRPENNPGEVLVAFVEDDTNVPEGYEFEGENYQWHPINKLHRLKFGYEQSDFITESLQEFVAENYKNDEPRAEMKRFF